jgi:secondary thiamine-phosphate synthase enzyme
MRQVRGEITITSPGQGLHDLTARIRAWVEHQGIELGLLTVFIHHTSASLVIQENADPDVLRDMGDAFARLVPEDPELYRHGSEGPDDMPAHIKGALTQTHLAIPVVNGRMDLGTWQGIYLFEHRRRGRERRLTLHLLGE